MKPFKLEYDGDIYWYREGMPGLHKEDGPAVEYNSGEKWWCINGLFHREDGPAVETLSGHNEWWYNGEKINASSTEEFKRLIKLKAFW